MYISQRIGASLHLFTVPSLLLPAMCGASVSCAPSHFPPGGTPIESLSELHSGGEAVFLCGERCPCASLLSLRLCTMSPRLLTGFRRVVLTELVGDSDHYQAGMLRQANSI